MSAPWEKKAGLPGSCLDGALEHVWERPAGQETGAHGVWQSKRYIPGEDPGLSVMEKRRKRKLGKKSRMQPGVLAGQRPGANL